MDRGEAACNDTHEYRQGRLLFSAIARLRCCILCEDVMFEGADATDKVDLARLAGRTIIAN